MKHLYSALLVLSFLTEALATVSLLAGPEGVQAFRLGGQWSMHYGFAALAIASVSLWAWPVRSVREATTPLLGVLMIFHTGLFVSLFIAGDQQAGMITHAVLAVLAVVLFSLRGKWCVPS